MQALAHSSRTCRLLARSPSFIQLWMQKRYGTVHALCRAFHKRAGLDTVKWLVANGADVNAVYARQDGTTMLQFAAKELSHEIVEVGTHYVCICILFSDAFRTFTESFVHFNLKSCSAW